MSWRFLACACAAVLFLCHNNSLAARHDSTQWENEIRAFESSDRTNPPPSGAVLFVGSSSIRYWTNLAESFPQLQTIRRGFGGSHLPDSTFFADRIILPYHPSKIVLYAGENDIARGDSPAEVSAAFREFVAKINAALPGTPIYFISIKPAPVRWYLSPQEIEANRLIQKICRRERTLHFVNVWDPLLDASGQPNPRLFKPDHLHLNSEGYKIWTRILTAALKD